MGKITIPGKDVPKNPEKGRGLSNLMRSQEEGTQAPKQSDNQTDRQLDSRTDNQADNLMKKTPYKLDPNYKMVTVYIKRDVLAEFHALTIKRGKELTHLANEAFEDLLTKYKI